MCVCGRSHIHTLHSETGQGEKSRGILRHDKGTFMASHRPSGFLPGP